MTNLGKRSWPRAYQSISKRRKGLMISETSKPTWWKCTGSKGYAYASWRGTKMPTLFHKQTMGCQIRKQIISLIAANDEELYDQKEFKDECNSFLQRPFRAYHCYASSHIIHHNEPPKVHHKRPTHHNYAMNF